MNPVLFRDARVLTMGGRPGARRGRAMGELGVIPRGDVLVMDGIIAEVTESTAPWSTRRSSLGGALRVVDARGRVVMPGFVDCHTHMCWAGSRVDEWERKLAGASYQDIAAAGGGIMSTVRAVRATTQGELACDLLGRIDAAVRSGSTTIEVKTGYGLTLEHERRMMLAIEQARGFSAASLVPTLLLGHAIDVDDPLGASGFVQRTIEITLPELSREFGCSPCVDAFCEQGAGGWSVEQCARLFQRAKALGHPVRVHADQFTSLGMVPAAIALGARSIDHLEASTADDLRALAQSHSIGVVLPVCGLHLDGRSANARGLIDAGGAVALATNANPGSAPCVSMSMAIGLGVRGCRMTCAEALIASTANAAAVLGLGDRGYIAPGARADLLLLEVSDEREIAYTLGTSPIESVMIAGRMVGENEP